MIATLVDHLRGLTRFSGREAPKPFWTWVAINIGLQMVAAMMIIGPMITDAIMRVESFADAHPNQVIRSYGPGSYSVQVHGYHPELIPDFSGVSSAFGIAALVTVLLLAASVARRLHDTDRNGAWGLMPLPFLAIGLAVMPRLFASMGDGQDFNLNLFFGLFINNLVYLATLGVLILLCAKSGTPDENRFGPPPV